jgi:hypothetical protein
MSKQAFMKSAIVLAFLLMTSTTTKSFAQTSIHMRAAHVLSAGDPLPPVPDPTNGGGGGN